MVSTQSTTRLARELLKAALDLSMEERALLAADLLATLDPQDTIANELFEEAQAARHA